MAGELRFADPCEVARVWVGGFGRAELGRGTVMDAQDPHVNTRPIGDEGGLPGVRAGQ